VLEFAKLAGSAFFGVIVGLFIQWWKSSRDEFRSLCDEFCETVRETSDVASSYWYADNSDEDIVAEARLTGLQRRLDGYRVLISSRLHDTHRRDLEFMLADFFDAITGGEFRSKSRKRDLERVVGVQTVGADVILCVRRGFANSMTFSSTMARHAGRLGKRLDRIARWPER
jgi:hypothetical protein